MSNKVTKEGRRLWLIYLAFIISGAILLGDALDVRFIAKLTARLGVGLVFSAMALIIGKDRPSGIIATAIVWGAIIISFFN